MTHDEQCQIVHHCHDLLRDHGLQKFDIVVAPVLKRLFDAKTIQGISQAQAILDVLPALEVAVEIGRSRCSQNELLLQLWILGVVASDAASGSMRLPHSLKTQGLLQVVNKLIPAATMILIHQLDQLFADSLAGPRMQNRDPAEPLLSHGNHLWVGVSMINVCPVESLKWQLAFFGRPHHHGLPCMARMSNAKL